MLSSPFLDAVVRDMPGAAVADKRHFEDGAGSRLGSVPEGVVEPVDRVADGGEESFAGGHVDEGASLGVIDRHAGDGHPVSRYRYVWGPRFSVPGLPVLDRKGSLCRVIVRGAMNSALVEFADGLRQVVSRNALRRAA